MFGMTSKGTGCVSKKYLLHTKIVLITTAVLIFGGALLFYLLEKDNVFAGMSGKEQLLGALFSAVTPRTAGFNSVDTAAMKESSKFLTMVLMFIGGSSGSTAGGVKVTTAVVMLLSTIAMIRGNPWSKYTKQAPGRGYGKKSQRHRHYRLDWRR